MNPSETSSSQSVVFDPVQHDTTRMQALHEAGVTILCRRCRSPFIIALTHEEAARHKVHPGIYCSQNHSHFQALVELHTDFWERFNKWWDTINRSTIIVLGDHTIDLSKYKVYIDRNIHGTGARFQHLAPPNSVYTRLPAGTHTIVVREYDVKKPDRLQSNTLQIPLQDDEQITIHATLRDGQIILTSSA